MQNQGFQSQKSNSLAITSLISGVLGWVIFLILLCINLVILPIITVATFGFGGIFYICTAALGLVSPISWLVAVVAGHVAHNQIKASGEGGLNMAKVGLITGYIGLGITVISICAIIVLLLAGVSVPLLDPSLYTS